MFCCISVFVVVLSVLFYWLNQTPPPQKILGVYSQPTRTYYFKVIFFYLLMTIRKHMAKSRSGDQGSRIGYGIKSRSRIEDMECPQPLSDHPKAIDAVYFNGASRAGQYLVMATARRPKGVINAMLYIRIPEIGILELPRIPDSILFGDGKSFEAEGLKISPVKPMESWKLEYQGKMKLHTDHSKYFDVKLDFMWTARFDYFDFDTDMHPWAAAKSLSREPWSKKYFEDLKIAHQTHYEQMGTLNGTVEVDGTPFKLSLQSMRDHSYGHKREWKLIHRYGLHMFHLEDGTSIHVGVVSQPITSSALELGYIIDPCGDINAVTSVNLPLWQHGESGTPPLDYAFSFVAGGKEYHVEVEIVESPEFYIGWEWEMRVVERMAKFRVNGIQGWGLAEWDYRNYGGSRPAKYAENDPEWTKTLNKG